MATATDLMTTEVPTASEQHTVSETLSALRTRSWHEVGHIYLVDGQHRHALDASRSIANRGAAG
jgi:Mg/Co/Ni transporter MgtE